MKTIKQAIMHFCLIGLMTNCVWATNDEFKFSATPIADNVYSIISPYYGRPTPENKGWNSNSHFVITDNGVLVFDTGSSKLIGEGIIKTINSVTDKPIRWVVNSHSHADHWLGNAAFVDLGAEILSSELSEITMKKNGKQDVEAFSRMTEGATGTNKFVYPTSLLKQAEKLNLERNFGGLDVKFIFSNDGHSLGDILMWLPKQRIIFGGDVLSSDYLPIMTPHGNVENLVETLNAVVKLDPVIVLPGHGQPNSTESVIRDSNMLKSVWSLVKKSLGNMTNEEVLLQVKTELGPKFRSLYKDFDSSITYLVTMIIKKQP